jgi:hypothetical protein
MRLPPEPLSAPGRDDVSRGLLRALVRVVQPREATQEVVEMSRADYVYMLLGALVLGGLTALVKVLFGLV